MQQFFLDCRIPRFFFLLFRDNYPFLRMKNTRRKHGNEKTIRGRTRARYSLRGEITNRNPGQLSRALRDILFVEYQVSNFLHIALSPRSSVQGAKLKLKTGDTTRPCEKSRRRYLARLIAPAPRARASCSRCSAGVDGLFSLFSSPRRDPVFVVRQLTVSRKSAPFASFSRSRLSVYQPRSRAP